MGELWSISAKNRGRGGDHISPVLGQRRVDFKLTCFVYSSLSGQTPPYTWLTTYTWFRKVQDVDSARPPTDRVLFHGRTTHLATEALLLRATSLEQPPSTLARRRHQLTVFGVNSKRFGFNVASGAQLLPKVN